MSTVTRICTQCGESFPLDSRYCTHCGHDTEASLPVPQNNLPALVGKAAVPVLVGAASFAVRAGWRLLQNYLARPRPQPSHHPVKVVNPQPLAPRRSVHVRTSWQVSDSQGNWRQGNAEYTIEFED
ncbi:MAG: zinc ribbon domain-containing protein [Caldilineaceae bacterium]|nr:zinc ribbon domain-containing protein [Caldilineaceae bacterium]